MNERLDMRGQVTLRLTDRDGNVVAERHRRNRIVRTGRQLVAQLFAGVSGGPPPTQVTHMAVGTGAAAPADDQVGLATERAPRKPIQETEFTDFDDGGTRRVRVSLRSVFDFGEANGPEPLREAGIFTAATAGVMYNRVVFDAVTKTNAFQLTLLWEITF
jgi:hypothetical protein